MFEHREADQISDGHDNDGCQRCVWDVVEHWSEERQSQQHQCSLVTRQSAINNKQLTTDIDNNNMMIHNYTYQPRNFSMCHSYLLTSVGMASATALLQHGIQVLLPLKLFLPIQFQAPPQVSPHSPAH